tara:strand:- start:311 stop:511 length:201 start_codon:yes stop_codon:yes gene_type:complete
LEEDQVLEDLQVRVVQVEEVVQEDLVDLVDPQVRVVQKVLAVEEVQKDTLDKVEIKDMVVIMESRE